MKKLAPALILLLALSVFCVGIAEDEMYVIRDCGTQMTADLDGDGENDEMKLVCDLDEYGDGSFTLTVNQASITIENTVCLEPTVYAMECPMGTLFMVYEWGPSDDPLTYCVLYSLGGLTDAGTIPASVPSFSVSPFGIITAKVRANMLGTWSREGDFMLATGYSCDYGSENYDVTWYACICEVPRDTYAMGMVVTLKRDLPLYASRYDAEPSKTLTGGQQVVLAASDDVCWLYVTDTDSTLGGWVRMTNTDGLDNIIIDSQAVSADEVFADIIYAD